MIRYQCDQCSTQAATLDGWTMETALGVQAHFDTMACRDAWVAAREAAQEAPPPA